MKYEFRRAKNRSGSPVLLSPDEFTGRAGFISMFGFNDQAEEFIASGRSTAGVDRFPLYSDRLYVEFDDNAAAEDKAINKLKELGYKFCVYHTGNRGHHIHIPITPVERTGLHHYMKAVATSMFKGCDDGIYKATGIIRIPGTVHASTGNKMVKVYEHDGKVMDIDDHRPRSYVPVKRVQEVDKDFLDFMLTRDLNTQASEGGGPHQGRNKHIFSIAATAMRLGLEKDVTESLMQDWNASMCHPPLRDSELKATLNSAYRRAL